MKQKFLSLSALVIAVVFAFAFKAAPMKFFADQQFQLAPGGNPNNPLAYNLYTGGEQETDCPDESEVCIIDVFNADVYNAATAPTPAHIGKPKVEAGGAVASDITTALGTSDPYVAPSGRTIWQRD